MIRIKMTIGWATIALTSICIAGSGVTAPAESALSDHAKTAKKRSLRERSASLWSEKVPLATHRKVYFVTPDGKAEGSGSDLSPWDLKSVVSGAQKIEPGSIVWVREGRYDNPGTIQLSGTAGKPIHLRAEPNKRVSIDGGMQIKANHLWIWDFEFASFKTDWRPSTAIGGWNSRDKLVGAQGPIDVRGGDGPMFINLIIHNNTMGVGYWKHIKDSEIHGCIIYDNGMPGTDRPHGPGIYSQNVTRTERLITDNIVAGNFSTGMQLYYGANSDYMVQDYTVKGNVFFAPRADAKGRNYVMCGSGGSKNIVIDHNVLHGYDLRVGSKTNQVVTGNIVLRGGFGSPGRDKNRVLGALNTTESILRPNKYDPRRANLVVLNSGSDSTVTVDLGEFLQQGDAFQILNSLDFYGEPITSGIFDGTPVQLKIPQAPWSLYKVPEYECWAFVIMKEMR